MKYLLPLLLLLASCAGMVRTSEVGDVLTDVLQRHDDYVFSDDTLTSESKDIFFGQSHNARKVVGEADEMTPAEFQSAIVGPVLRHQEYVREDVTITELERRVWLRSGDVLLGVGR
jgi:hypothetical protein